MRRYGKAFLLIMTLVWWSCEPVVEEPPTDLIAPDTMKEILLEMHLSESYVDIHLEGKDTARVLFKNLEKQIYDKHQITEQAYKDSYNYYLRNTDELDAIYEQVVKELAKMESRAKASGKTDKEEKKKPRKPKKK